MASASSAPSLEFQFWDDRRWQSYGPSTQRELGRHFLAPRRPNNFGSLPPDGKYRIDGFGEVEKGYARQVNVQTNFERPVRLRPPYALPGHDAPMMPAGEVFLFEVSADGATWHPYPQELQDELGLLAKSAPPPERVFCAEEGRQLFLLGFDSVAAAATHGKAVELTEIDKRTQIHRQVRVRVGRSPGGGGWPRGPTKGAVPLARSGSTGSAQFQSLSSSCVATFAGAASSAAKWIGRKPQTARRGGSFSLQQAEFFAADRVNEERLPRDYAEAVLHHWRREPRPSGFEIRGLRIINFGKLEVGGAGLQMPPSPGPAAVKSLRVRFPAPVPGRVVLPDELDSAGDEDLLSYARILSDQEVAALAAKGSEARQCSICLLEMEPKRPSNGFPSGEEEVCMLKCGHAYHAACLRQWFRTKQRCPQCQTQYGKVIGQQPALGTMSWYIESFALHGHDDAPQTIIVQFNFPPGMDENQTRYEGRNPKGYLPGNAQGVILLELFKIAFRRRVMFGLGNSATFNTFRPTYNIHIKTSTHRGATGHGYPDPDYFSRALDELRANGVTCQDLT